MDDVQCELDAPRCMSGLDGMRKRDVIVVRECFRCLVGKQLKARDPKAVGAMRRFRVGFFPRKVFFDELFVG